jgi:hypothetical protein
LFQVDIDRREQCCAANYEQVVNHVVTVEQRCNNMLTILFIVGCTTLFTPVDINLEEVVDFLNFYVCKFPKTMPKATLVL